MKNLSSKDFESQLKSDKESILLDVRTKEEYDKLHIPDSILLDIRNPQEFMGGIDNLDKTKNYYVYCHSGVRSVQACQIMASFGFSNLFNLLGGISDWSGLKKNN
tara:strand:+ start:10165 stop:10479 length:315 start_codon:yes stop_codon:yes gene_type:complete